MFGIGGRIEQAVVYSQVFLVLGKLRQDKKYTAPDVKIKYD